MRHFKLPLLVTVVTVVLAIVAGLFLVTAIHRARISDREKMDRAQKAGGAVAVSVLLIVTPFWLIGAARLGRERRQARENAGGTP